MSISYNTIGKDFTVRVELNQLSGRDKSNLLATLLEEAGITAAIVNTRGEAASKIILKGLQKLWDGE